MIFLDTETCGFHGLPVIIQYAVDDGSVQLYNFWKNPISESVELLEWIASQEVVGFNLAFDWFHIIKIWSTFSMLLDDPDLIPEDNIDLIATTEKKARDYGYCLKPKAACDLMLHARKGKYQCLMRRKPITIRRIPTQLISMVRQELEKLTDLDDAYFSQRSDPSGPRWAIRDIKFPDGSINPAFKNLELDFRPSTGLKTLTKYALGKQDDLILKFTDVEVSKKFYPKEFGYAPFALAVGRPGRWNNAWPEVIRHHISHWEYNTLARKYAADDVINTRELYYHLEPEIGDTDSELSCMVAAVRWRGFEIDIEKIKELRLAAAKRKAKTPTAPNAVKGYLLEVMDKTESMALNNGTGKDVLKSIIEWDSPAAKRAQEVLDARFATKEIELFDKLIKAGKFHASFRVIGALSSRMSGDNDLNAQGIKGTKEIRQKFKLKRDGYKLCGGDFDAFEVSIAESVYNDENLRADIISGKSPHGLFACELYPHLTYEEILATKGTEDDLYGNGKTGFFRIMYGGGWEGMVEPLDVDPKVAEKAFNGFMKKYPGIKRYLDTIESDYCSMTQPAGIGTAVVWKDPKPWVDNGLGFKRYFDIENKICKMLFDLANDPPKIWKYVKAKVMRKDRQQTAAGAVQSALYAAAFNIQAKNLRAAANHQIQSKGATITKEVQRAIWDLQPAGVAKWLVQPMNIHDEVMCPTTPEMVDDVENTVKNKVESFRDIIPLLSITWNKDMNSWAEK